MLFLTFVNGQKSKINIGISGKNFAMAAGVCTLFLLLFQQAEKKFPPCCQENWSITYPKACLIL